MSRPRPPKVRVQAKRTDPTTGEVYAILRWTTEQGRQEATLGWISPEAAEEARADREAELRLGVSRPSTAAAVTVDDLVAAYLVTLEDTGAGSARYRQHELLHCHRIGDVLGTRLADRLTEADLRRLVRHLRDTPTRTRQGMRSSSVRDVLRCLRAVYRHGIGEGLTQRPPPSLPRSALLDDARPARRLTEAEVAALAQAGAQEAAWLGRLLLFLAWCPRRPVAVLDLRREDCVAALDEAGDRTQARVWFRRDKAGRGRGWSPLTEPALLVLREQLAASAGEPGDLVWLSPWAAR